MVLNLLFFTVRIERNALTPEKRMARIQQDELLKARDEAYVNQSAQFPQITL